MIDKDFLSEILDKLNWLGKITSGSAKKEVEEIKEMILKELEGG